MAISQTKQAQLTTPEAVYDQPLHHIRIVRTLARIG